MPVPILIEAGDPSGIRYWTVKADAELPEHQMAMHIDQGLHAAIFPVSCSCRCSRSSVVKFEPRPASNILPVRRRSARDIAAAPGFQPSIRGIWKAKQ